MKSVRFIFLAILIVAAQNLRAASIHETVRKEIPATGIEKVSISSTNGTIVITTWDKDSISVVARKKVDGSGAKARALLQKIKIFADRQGNLLKIYAQVPKRQRHGFWNWLFGLGIKNYSVDWTIRVPASMPVSASSTNGDIELDDLKAPVEISTTNGGINALRIGGSSKIQSTNGDIHVFYKTMPKKGRIAITTTNGGIELIVPGNASCAVSAYTTNGEISCDLPDMHKTSSSGRSLETVVGDGAVKIDLETTNGDISIMSK